jgi:hypothetical protein
MKFHLAIDKSFKLFRRCFPFDYMWFDTHRCCCTVTPKFSFESALIILDTGPCYSTTQFRAGPRLTDLESYDNSRYIMAPTCCSAITLSSTGPRFE